MDGTLKFFLNAFKAILLSPFYLAAFAAFLLYSLITHLVGEIKVLFTGFKYGTKNENKYTKELNYKIKLQNGGDSK